MYYFQGPVFISCGQQPPTFQPPPFTGFIYKVPSTAQERPAPPPALPPPVDKKSSGKDSKKPPKDNKSPSVASGSDKASSKSSASSSSKGSGKSSSSGSNKGSNSGSDKGSKKVVEVKSGKVAVKVTTQAPPNLRVGVNYMFPSEHTCIHIISKAAPIWEKKYEGIKFRFNIYKVGTQMTVKEVIQNTMSLKVGGDWDKCKGWAATEVIEHGNGKWIKGSTIEYTSDRSKGSLASMGWSVKRGDTLPPVWITVHQIEVKK